MLIIWGTKHRKEEAGEVAEKCHSCNDVKAFKVVKHFEVSHIYYIGLGKGTHKTTSMTCRTCGAEYNCDPEDYDCILPTRAGTRSILELAERTNSKLLDTMKAKVELAAQVKQAEKSGAVAEADHARMMLALKKLEEFETVERGAQLIKKLKQWLEMEKAMREALLKEIDDFVEAHAKIQKAFSVIAEAARTFPKDAGCVTGFLAFLALLSPLVFFPFLQSWGWGIGLGLLAFLLGILALAKVGNARKTKWVRAKLIPLGQARGLDFTYFVGALLNIDSKDEGIDEKIRELAGAADVIGSVLLEDGLVKLQEVEEEAPGPA